MRSVAAMLCGLFAVPLLVPCASAQAVSGRARTEHATIAALNVARAHYGVPRVRWSPALTRAARLHSRHMSRTGVFAHGAFASRLARFSRARAIGENLAWVPSCGRRSARTVVSMWLHSPPHRAVLLSRSYTRVGIGVRHGTLGSHGACLVTADFSS